MHLLAKHNNEVLLIRDPQGISRVQPVSEFNQLSHFIPLLSLEDKHLGVECSLKDESQLRLPLNEVLFLEWRLYGPVTGNFCFVIGQVSPPILHFQFRNHARSPLVWLKACTATRLWPICLVPILVP